MNCAQNSSNPRLDERREKEKNFVRWPKRDEKFIQLRIRFRFDYEFFIADEMISDQYLILVMMTGMRKLS